MELPDLNIVTKMSYDLKNPEYLQLYHWGHYEQSSWFYFYSNPNNELFKNVIFYNNILMQTENFLSLIGVEIFL